ncbi:hypothetical protein CA51_41350 [Rosistilla oblonga]|nr:hypothetical protein CA51_41350 [Rosistilla oblonga]
MLDRLFVPELQIFNVQFIGPPARPTDQPRRRLGAGRPDTAGIDVRQRDQKAAKDGTVYEQKRQHTGDLIAVPHRGRVARMLQPLGDRGSTSGMTPC